MSESRPTLTTSAGAPVADNQNSQTAGPSGPVLLQDGHLLEKLAHFNRERIPERVVHAVGMAAHGTFTVTRDVTAYTRAAFLGKVGRTTEVFTRFSTVAGSRGAADTARDPRGFAVKFYTGEGNYDLVGNNTPVFFIKDPLKFPDFIHSQKPDPHTNQQEPDTVWDFFSHSPEATHQFTWLFGDRGIPRSLRHMDGFGSHTYRWTNGQGESVWVKYHFETDQGNDFLTSEEAAGIGGQDPAHHLNDLRTSIENGNFPSWTLHVQVMPEADAASYRFNPFDLTKVWPKADYPLIEVGRMTLDRMPDNFFASTEQVAFNPSHFVPGIGPSPDKMLQGRLFGYGDAHRYRLGINHAQLPINAPKATEVRPYHRDGAMRLGDNGGSSANYEPNSRGGATQTGEPLWAPYDVSGLAASHERIAHAEDDNFVQAGALYRLQPEAAQQRLVDNIAGSLSRVTLPGVVERSIEHFRAADQEYGDRIEAAVKELRA
jgi:catalase